MVSSKNGMTVEVKFIVIEVEKKLVELLEIEGHTDN